MTKSGASKDKIHDSVKQPPTPPPFSFLFFFFFVGWVCCSPVLRCVWLCEAARVCTAPFQFLRVCEHTSPFYLFSPSLSLAQSRQTKDGGGGVSWNTEGSLSGIFSYGFLQACILNTLCHNIFSYSTQGCWGTSRPLLCSLPTSLFHSWPISPPCTPGQKKKIQRKSEKYAGKMPGWVFR